MDLWPEGVKAWYERLRYFGSFDTELRAGTGSRYEILARALHVNEYLASDIGELAAAPPPSTWAGRGESAMRKKEIIYLERLIQKRAAAFARMVCLGISFAGPLCSPGPKNRGRLGGHVGRNNHVCSRYSFVS